MGKKMNSELLQAFQKALDRNIREALESKKEDKPQSVTEKFIEIDKRLDNYDEIFESFENSLASTNSMVDVILTTMKSMTALRVSSSKVE